MVYIETFDGLVNFNKISKLANLSKCNICSLSANILLNSTNGKEGIYCISYNIMIICHRCIHRNIMKNVVKELPVVAYSKGVRRIVINYFNIENKVHPMNILINYL